MSADGGLRRRSLHELLQPRPVAVLLALVALILAGGSGAAVAGSSSSAYASTTVLVIDQPLVVAAATDPGPVDKLNRLRLQYAALLQTAVVADVIAQRTGKSAAEVSASVSARGTPTSLLIIIEARDPTREGASELATASADALIGFARNSQAAAEVPTKQRVELSVVTPARGATEITRGPRALAAVALAVGLVAAAAVYVLVSLLGAVRRR